MPSAAKDQQAIDDAVESALYSKRLTDLEEQYEELKADRDKFLRWGVIVLGGACVGLVTWIFNLVRPGH